MQQQARTRARPIEYRPAIPRKRDERRGRSLRGKYRGQRDFSSEQPSPKTDARFDRTTDLRHRVVDNSGSAHG